MPLLKRLIITILVSTMLLIITTEALFAVNLPFRLTWNRNSESDVAFYTVYYGTSSGHYTDFKDVPHPANPATNPHCDFCDSNSPDCDPSYAQITPPGTYYITVTATDFSLNESDFSFELPVPIDQTPPPSTTTSTIRSTTTSPATTTAPTTTTTTSPSGTTTSPATTTTALTTDGITYENGEDQSAERWYVYDSTPAGAEIENVFDNDRQSNVVRFSGAGTDNGYRLNDSGGNLWHNTNHFIIQWSMKYTQSFTIYIDLTTSAGHRYLTYTPHNYNNLGYGEYVEHGLGSDAVNGQWHTFVRDLRADLAQSQPGTTILEVNGFLIRGSGMVDDIMLLNYFPSSTTTIPIVSQQGEYCSTDPDLVLNGTTPEVGTMRVAIPANALPQDSVTREDGEDGTTDRWHVYDDVPGGAQITNIFDSNRQSRVIQFSGAGTDNGYRLTNPDGTFWNDETHSVVKWSMKYAELFTIYIDLETTAGHRYLTYRPSDSNSLGDAEYVLYGLGRDVIDGQWHTFVRDLQADLNVAQPGVRILEVNGFLIRGSGMVDDIKLITINDALFPYLRLTLFDPDSFGEGYVYVNGNGPINLPTGNYNNLEHTFQIPISSTCLLQGENTFRFVHVSDWGYEVRELCIGGLLGGSTATSTTTIPLPRPTTTTTTVKPDTTPPRATISINQGAATTDCQIVTLYLSAEDDESGMGEGAQMMFSKHDTTQWSDPMPFEPEKQWTLSPGKGERTIYAKFCDAAGNWMDEPVSDTIMLISSCPSPRKLNVSSLDSSSVLPARFSEHKIVDDNVNTGWLSPLRLSQRDESITIDLGETQTVNRVDISSNPFRQFDLFPYDFEVQASTDNKNWVNLFTVEHYSPPSSRSESWTFEEIETRYIRMAITRSKRFLLFFYAAYVADISVYGCTGTETAGFESALSTSTVQTDTSEIEQTQELLRNSGIIPGSELWKGTTATAGNSVTNSTFDPLNGAEHIYECEGSIITCDNESPFSSFSGMWNESDKPDAYGGTSLISREGGTHTWTPDLLKEGYYQLYMWWSSSRENCSSCPVEISCDGALIDTLYVDQQQDGGQWNLLGPYYLEGGNVCSVTILSGDASLETCADAVRFVAMEENLPEARINFIYPNPAAVEEEICFEGYGTPGDGMIEDYQWTSNLDGVLSTDNSFCTTSLSEGTHHISFTVKDDTALCSLAAEAMVSVGIEAK